MTIAELRAALETLPDDMPVMMLGEGVIVQTQSGDAGDAHLPTQRLRGPRRVLWLIGEEWRAPS